MILLTLFMTLLKILAGILIIAFIFLIISMAVRYKKALNNYINKLEQGDTIEVLLEGDIQKVTFIKFIDKNKKKLYVKDEDGITHIITLDKLKF